MPHTSTQAGQSVSTSSVESDITFSIGSSGDYDGCLSATTTQPYTINFVDNEGNKLSEQMNLPLGDEKQEAVDFHGELYENVYEKVKYKFNEGKLLRELKEHVDKTYESHYSKNKFQATEFILDSGHGTGFCVGNIMKYAQRYGKKGDQNEQRRDLLKILHYALIQLHIHDEGYK